jgi:hypothetical protein
MLKDSMTKKGKNKSRKKFEAILDYMARSCNKNEKSKTEFWF